jgi:hypothetical protein
MDQILRGTEKDWSDNFGNGPNLDGYGEKTVKYYMKSYLPGKKVGW